MDVFDKLEKIVNGIDKPSLAMNVIFTNLISDMMSHENGLTISRAEYWLSRIEEQIKSESA